MVVGRTPFQRLARAGSMQRGECSSCSLAGRIVSAPALASVVNDPKNRHRAMSSLRASEMINSLRMRPLAPAVLVNGGGIMLHAERSGGLVAAAQNCATDGPLSVATRGGGCAAWSFMRRFDWRLSRRV